MEFLKTGTFRRIIAAAAAVALPILNRKLGLELDPTEVITGVVFLAGYIGQSAVKDIGVQKAAAEAAANVKTVEDAIAAMKAAGLAGKEVSK